MFKLKQDDTEPEKKMKQKAMDSTSRHAKKIRKKDYNCLIQELIWSESERKLVLKRKIVDVHVWDEGKMRGSHVHNEI